MVATELMPSAVLPTMSADLGVATSIGGLLVTAWAFTIVATSLPLVRRLSTVRRRPLLAASLGVVAAANVATALAPTFPFAILARITAAGAHGLFWAIVVAHVASLVDTAKLGRALAIVLAGPTFSGLIGLPIGALMADRFGGVRSSSGSLCWSRVSQPSSRRSFLTRRPRPQDHPAGQSVRHARCS